MESRKRMEYGFQGYQAPALPRATRSARGRGAGNRKKTGDGNNGDGNGMVFFELLATVAGELLQEQENHKPESEVQGNKSMENCDGTVGNALGEEGNCLEQALLEPDKSHIITNEDALQKQGSIGQVNKLDPDDQGSSDENAIASGASHRKLFLGDPPLKEDPDPIVQSASRSASSISKFDPLGKLSGTEKGSDLCMDAELVDEKPLQGISYAVRGGKKGSSRTEKELYFMNACEGKVSTEQSLLSAVQGLLDSGGEQAKESMGVVENGEGKGENEIDENNIGQWKREHHACENTEDEMMLDTHSLLASSAVSGEAPLCRETKPPPLVSSGSSGEAPLCIGSKPRDSFFNVPNGRIKVSRDDDDNSSGCTVPHRMTKKSFRTPYLRGAKLRRVIGAKIRKTVSASSNKRKHSEMDIMTNTERIAKSEMPGCGVGFTWQRTVKYASSKRKRLAEGTYFPISNVHTSTASASGIDSNGVNEPPASAAKMRRAKSASVASSPTSAAGSSKHSSKRSGESHVKLSIKSFTVPELCIDMPETATVTSLKRAVMEAAMNLLGGGLHVRVLLQGKKIPDESETLLQVGISNGGKLDTVGFMLEPNPVPASPACAEDPLFVLSRAATQPSSRYPMGSQTPGPAVVADSNKGLTKGRSNKINGIAGADVAVTTAGRKQTDGSQWENNEYELITSSSHVQAGSNPGALIVHPSVGADNDSGLALVPLSHKSRGSEIGKRRIRRPFTVAEVEALVHAVEKLGTGRWRDVKLRAFDHAKHRTYVDLKDKWKTLVHTAKIAPHQRRGEPVPQELLDRVICAHNYWSDQQAKQQAELCL